MVQEEKLAGDVYLTLAKMYPTIPIFSNIADSEQTHVNSVMGLHEWIGKVQNYPDIVKVFEFLMMGGRNYLRSFYWTLKNVYGIEYHPQYVGVEEFNQIINSPMEIPATFSVLAGAGGGQHGKLGG